MGRHGVMEKIEPTKSFINMWQIYEPDFSDQSGQVLDIITFLVTNNLKANYDKGCKLSYFFQK